MTVTSLSSAASFWAMAEADLSRPADDDAHRFPALKSPARHAPAFSPVLPR
jgi:hypothetical protein